MTMDPWPDSNGRTTSSLVTVSVHNLERYEESVCSQMPPGPFPDFQCICEAWEAGAWGLGQFDVYVGVHNLVGICALVVWVASSF